MAEHHRRAQPPISEPSPKDFLAEAPARLNELRLAAERARMAFTKAMKDLRATPKDSPEREYRREQFRSAREAHRMTQEKVEGFETMIGIVRDSEASKAEEALEEQRERFSSGLREWQNQCRKAQEPFEFVLVKNRPRVRMVRSAIRAPCGQACINEASARDHAASCEACRAARAEKSSEPLVLEI